MAKQRLGDALLLLCAQVGFALSFLSLYGDNDILWEASAHMAGFALAAAVFALVSLCAWSLPRFRGAAAGALAALWAGAALLGGARGVAGAGLTLRALSEVFSDRVLWGVVIPYESDLSAVSEDGAVALFLLLALAGLALALGWAVVRARRWWMAALLTLPPLLPGLLADLYPNWPAFMALTACWLTMLFTDLCRWSAPGRRGALTLAALCAVILTLSVMSLALPREGYTRPPWALRAEDRLYAAGGDFSDFFSQMNGPFRRRASYVGASGTADLNNAGPLRYTNRTALRLTAGYDGRLYLRGVSLAVYQDGVWTGLPDGVYQDYLDGLEEEPPFPLTLPALLGSPATEHTAVIENLGAAGSCAYAPYFLTDQDWEEAGMLPVEDSYLARLRGQAKFTVTFADVEPPEATGPTVRYQNLVYANYLDVPEDLEEALAPLVGQVPVFWSSASSVYWRDPFARIGSAQRVAQLLEERCQYDSQAPAPPEGVDPVDYFLNDSRRGYCMHYASAAALALRSLGIPARYVSGYTALCQSGETVNVPDRAAHAWVEIWLDGFGWYPVEVTPPAAFAWYEQGDAQPSPSPSPSGEPTPTPSDTPTQEPTPSPTQTPGVPGGEDELQGKTFGLAPLLMVFKVLALAAVAAALAWLGQDLPKRRRARRLADPDPTRAGLYSYRCLLRLERWGGRVDEQAHELAQKATFSRNGLSEGERAELRGLLGRERAQVFAALSPLKRLAFRYRWGTPGPPEPPDAPNE